MNGLSRKMSKLSSLVNREAPSEQGFTMVELLAAVVLLGFALTTLISMQTNFAESYFQEESRTRAAMYSQYILALIETADEPPDAGSERGDLTSKLEELGYFNENHQREDDIILEGWEYELEIESIPVLEIEDALRKVELIIAWGESDRERFPVLFYMKNRPEQEAFPG